MKRTLESALSITADILAGISLSMCMRLHAYQKMMYTFEYAGHSVACHYRWAQERGSRDVTIECPTETSETERDDGEGKETTCERRREGE